MRKTEEILRTLLHQKGIDTQEDISEFLSDRPQKTYDPFLLYNMEAGVDLLLSEIKKNTKICIYGDYDADGVTSVCILSSVLSHLTSNFIHYIPSRVEEGYGLNKNAVRKLADQGGRSDRNSGLRQRFLRGGGSGQRAGNENDRDG